MSKTLLSSPIHRIGFASGQRGAVLVISLIFLLIMTLIGATAIRNTTLDEKMTGNTRDQDVSFQAAEVGLREAEARLGRLSNKPDFCDAEALTATTCQSSLANYTKVWDNTQFQTLDITDTNVGRLTVPSADTKDADRLWNNKTIDYKGVHSTPDMTVSVDTNNDGTPDTTIPAVSHDPVYLVQYLEFVRDALDDPLEGRHYYRLASRGFGGTDTTESILETTFTRRF